MQIILSDEEIETIHEALITEEAEAEQNVVNDESRGRDTKRRVEYRDKVSALRERFYPYLERTQ